MTRLKPIFTVLTDEQLKEKEYPHTLLTLQEALVWRRHSLDQMNSYLETPLRNMSGSELEDAVKLFFSVAEKEGITPQTSRFKIIYESAAASYQEMEQEYRVLLRANVGGLFTKWRSSAERNGHVPAQDVEEAEEEAEDVPDGEN